jgi:glutamine amidotransferase
MSAQETTVIVDYGSGNLHSAEKAFARAAQTAGGRILVSARPEDVAAADRIVLPGVGAFGDCAAGVAAVDGLRAAIEQRVRQDGRPFFGICVGMQLMAERGLERGVFDGFGWLQGEVRAIEPADPALKIPHMGWNALELAAGHALFADLPAPAYTYFVHSFHMVAGHAEERLATVDHGGPITAVVGRDNLFGTQFHPEKSQAVGLKLIENFLRWRP